MAGNNGLKSARLSFPDYYIAEAHARVGGVYRPDDLQPSNCSAFCCIAVGAVHEYLQLLLGLIDFVHVLPTAIPLLM